MLRNEKYRPVTFAQAARHYADAPGYRMLAGELHGPCPDCGAGTDRFRINEKPTGEAGFHCRQCGGPRMETIHAMRDAIRGNGFLALPDPDPDPPKSARRTTTADARRLWNRAAQIPGAENSPAHPCNTWAASFGAQVPRWPAALAYRGGCLLARFDAQRGECVRVEKIALHGREKRTIGNPEGSACIVADPAGAGECWLAEGVKDALALGLLLHAAGIRARVAALGGTTGAKPAPALFAAGGRRIVIALDNDPEGIKAARRLGGALEKARPFMRIPPKGVNDWADLLAYPAPLETKTRFLQNG